MLKYDQAINVVRNVTTGILLSSIKDEADVIKITKIQTPEIQEDEIDVLNSLVHRSKNYIHFLNFISSVLKQKDCTSHSKFNKNLYEAIALYDSKCDVYFGALEINDLFYKLTKNYVELNMELEEESIEDLMSYDNVDLEDDDILGGACNVSVKPKKHLSKHQTSCETKTSNKKSHNKIVQSSCGSNSSC